MTLNTGFRKLETIRQATTTGQPIALEPVSNVAMVFAVAMAFNRAVVLTAPHVKAAPTASVEQVAFLCSNVGSFPLATAT
jgi:hypothetical protein